MTTATIQDKPVTINLFDMPQGQSYEDRYQGYLKIFERIAAVPKGQEVVVLGAPWSWVPLLWHLNCGTRQSRVVFEHCRYVDGALYNTFIDRTSVEVLCGFRPETSDALWKLDVGQYSQQRVRQYPKTDEFIVTTNGSFHRPEVMEFRAKLHAYVPKKRNVVLVPCAADKPYPAPMHQKVLEMMPDDYYMMNVTGVLGLIPMDLWPDMPWYDSGIPNRWRVAEDVQRYFAMYPHDRIISYCDFYNQAIEVGLNNTVQRASIAIFVNEVKFYHDYLDLMAPDRLAKLKRAFDYLDPRMSSLDDYNGTHAYPDEN